ncbi:MAG: anion permease [Pyramidobacter sp.]|uniref:anion permease n=1 Tax=Pyramidobacter sp. TaxID=1943581 RepID=UPI002A80E003|nr:anion permease [Pyramidobacter sp.]MDY4031729.1 anion permease [Pyramidobacter sp.]
MDPVSAFAKGVNWHVVFATGSVLLVGSAMASDKCGIAAWLLAMFSDGLGHMDIIPIMIVVALLSCIVAQFFSNSATAIIFLTALAPLAVVMLGKCVNVSVFPPIIGIGTLTACLLPSGSGQSATMLGTEIFPRFRWSGVGAQ